MQNEILVIWGNDTIQESFPFRDRLSAPRRLTPSRYKTSVAKSTAGTLLYEFPFRDRSSAPSCLTPSRNSTSVAKDTVTTLLGDFPFQPGTAR